LLVSIQRQCRQRRAELETAALPPRLPEAPERPQSVFAMAEDLPPISEAERFAAAIEQMPPDGSQSLRTSDHLGHASRRTASATGRAGGAAG
jgi:hypothetical protein